MFRCLIFVATATLLLAMPAAASNLAIVNGSRHDIWNLYLSTVDRNQWGPDQLGDKEDDLLKADTTLTLTNVDDGQYDIKAVLDDGRECILRNVEIVGDLRWLISEQTLRQSCTQQ